MKKKILKGISLLLLLSFLASCGNWRWFYRQQKPINYYPKSKVKKA